MSKKKKNIKIAEQAEEVKIPLFTGEDFEASVKELRVEDIEMKTSSEKKKMSRGENIFQVSLIIVFATVFIICAVMLEKNIWGKIKGNDVYKNAADDFAVFIPGEIAKVDKLYSALGISSSDSSMQSLYSRLNSGKTDSANSDSQYSEQLKNIRASISSFKAVNADVYGWIYVAGTNINYPIMRGQDNDYYLDHAYTNEYIPIGSIFLDYTTKDTITDNYNTVIYGHNVTTGAMFHDVTKFLQKDFFDNNLIYIYTMDGVFTYKPVAIYPTTSDYFYYKTEFANETSFVSYANELLTNSQNNAGVQFASGDTMITLSTCTNGASTGRYALHAKLIEVIK